MTICWRLVMERHQHDAFSGEGARLFGGRWNHKGIPTVYLSQNLSLSALEMFVRLTRKDIRIRFLCFKIELPGSVKTEEIPVVDLPKDWQQQPPPESTKDIGTRWLKDGRSVLLRVPSVIIPQEFNYLLNHLHPDFKKIKVRKPALFSYTPTMWK